MKTIEEFLRDLKDRENRQRAHDLAIEAARASINRKNVTRWHSHHPYEVPRPIRFVAALKARG